MTPREIESLAIAKLEHEGHQVTPVEKRAVGYMVIDSIEGGRRYR